MAEVVVKAAGVEAGRRAVVVANEVEAEVAGSKVETRVEAEEAKEVGGSEVLVKAAEAKA